MDQSEQLCVSFHTGPDSSIDHHMDALAVAAGASFQLVKGVWSPFSLLDAHRQNLREDEEPALLGSRLYLEGDLHCAIGDESELSLRRPLIDAHLKFGRPDGVPYAALYDGAVRLAALTPGGSWFASQGVLDGVDGPAHGGRLYILSPAYDRSLPLAPLGPRQRLSALSA